MPYQISVENNVVNVALTGCVTADDLAGLAIEAVKHDNAAVVPHRIADLSGVTAMDIRFPEVMNLAHKRRAAKFRNAFKAAIIAPQSYLLGYARMFQTLNDNPQIIIKIFSDRQSAIEWIAAPMESCHEEERADVL